MLVVFSPTFVADIKVIFSSNGGTLLSFITNQEHWFSPTQTSHMLRAGFEPAHNLNSGFFE